MPATLFTTIRSLKGHDDWVVNSDFHQPAREEREEEKEEMKNFSVPSAAEYFIHVISFTT